MTSLEDKRAHRLEFMKALYEKTDGRELEMLDMWSLGEELGFSREETAATAEYLVGEYLMEYAALGGAISITHAGVREVEQSILNPEAATEHFPPINVIQIGQMSHSQVQQGTHDSAAIFQAGASLEAVAEFLHEAVRVRADLQLDPDASAELDAELATLEAQLKSARPRASAVGGALAAIRDILVGAAGNLSAQALLERIAALT